MRRGWKRRCSRGRKPSHRGQAAARTPPDFAAIHEQLRQHKYVTLQLLWEEYRQANPDGYRYSRFCELYQRWRSKLDVVLRQEHKAGEKMFVDWAGATIPVLRPAHRPGLAGAIVRGRARRQLLHLGRGHARSADGSVAAGARARLRTFRRHSGAGGSRQHQDRRDQGAPLRSGSEPDLLQLRACTAASASCPRGRTSRATRPRSKMPCKWPSAGSWRRCAIASSSRSKN